MVTKKKFSQKPIPSLKFSAAEIKAHRLAVAMLSKAHAPYSNFRVGAVLYSAAGKTSAGCNVENASYGATICAERTAVLRAVAEGQKKFDGIVIVAAQADSQHLVYPCGLCRQTLKEFFKDDFEVLMGDPQGLRERSSLGELLPHGFGPSDL